MGRLSEMVRRRATEVITYKRQTGHTSSGDATYAAAATMAARIERGTGEVTDLEGRGVSGSHVLLATEELKVGDVVWLPEGDTADINESFRVLRVEGVRDIAGEVSHWSVVCA